MIKYSKIKTIREILPTCHEYVLVQCSSFSKNNLVVPVQKYVMLACLQPLYETEVLKTSMNDENHQLTIFIEPA